MFWASASEPGTERGGERLGEEWKGAGNRSVCVAWLKQKKAQKDGQPTLRVDIVRGSLSSSPSGFILKELRSDMQESGIKIPALTKRKARELLPQEDVIGPCETDPFTPHLEP